jgi:hypothetical protein
MGAPHSDIIGRGKQSLSPKAVAPEVLAPQATSPAPIKSGIRKNPSVQVTSLSTTDTEEEASNKDPEPSPKNTETDGATPNAQPTTAIEGPCPCSWKKPPIDIEDVTSE